MDGEAHGALPSCPEVGCKGRLRIEGGKVVCPGAYNDEIGGFVRCYFKVDPSTVSRTAWRTAARSESELAEESAFKATVTDSTSANLFEGLDMSSMAGKKSAADILLRAAEERGVDVPAAEQEAKVRFGALVMTNLDKSANEMLALAEQMFGTKSAAAAKAEGSKTGTVCADNAG